MVRALLFSFAGLVLFFFIALHPQEVAALVQQFMDTVSTAGQHVSHLQQVHQQTTTTNGRG